MLLTFFPCGSGGGGASLDITAYASIEARPAAAEENAIAIITSMMIGKVTVDVNVPSTPSTGDLWISRVETSNVILTVGDDQRLTVPIGQTRQWTGTAWEYVYGYLWNGTEWVRFSAVEMQYTYTGNHEKIDDGEGNWRIRLLTSGVLTFDVLPNPLIDVFIVGGGGGCGNSGNSYSAGAGGGYTTTELNYTASDNTEFQIVVGAGGVGYTDGGDSAAFGFSAIGGKKPTTTIYTGKGGAGGSGGGGVGGSAGGSDGSNGVTGSVAGSTYGGVGQGTTTREFGEAGGTLYAGGGGGCPIGVGGEGGGGNGQTSGDGGTQKDGVENTGGGAGGSHGGDMRYGGSGIVIIRNHRAA